MDYSTVLYKDSQLEPEIGRIIPLCTINQIFFGNSDPFCISGKMTLLNTNIIMKKNGVYYLNLAKLDEYFDLMKASSLNELSFCPYNYYKYIQKTNIPEHYKNMIDVIDEYIEYLDSLDEHFSNTIKYIIFNKGLYNGEVFANAPTVISMKFNKMGTPLIIHFTYDDASGSFLSLSKNRTNEQYQSLYNIHKTQLLMADPKVFLINNLERVTGNLSFSEMAVNSYLIKNDFTTPLYGLVELVLWKDDESKIAYIDFFVKKYSNIIKESKDGIMTNFEGFNKFLLNLEIKYLQQWEVKEQYNELYYQITHELIKSFDLLYQNKL